MGNHATPPEPSGPSDLSRLVGPLIFMLLGFLFLSAQMPPGTSAPREVSYSEIKALIRTGKVREATLEATAIVVFLHKPTAEGASRLRAISPQQPDAGARDKVMMGTVRTMAIQPDEKHRLAVHEAGHTAAAFYTPGADPIYKVTIIPRGRSLGSTHMLPEHDRHTLPEACLRVQLATLLAGRAAEKLLLGLVSSGPFVKGPPFVKGRSGRKPPTAD